MLSSTPIQKGRMLLMREMLTCSLTPVASQEGPPLARSTHHSFPKHPGETAAYIVCWFCTSLTLFHHFICPHSLPFPFPSLSLSLSLSLPPPPPSSLLFLSPPTSGGQPRIAERQSVRNLVFVKEVPMKT